MENLTKIVLLRGICTFSTIYESYYFGDCTKWIRTKRGSPVLMYHNIDAIYCFSSQGLSKHRCQGCLLHPTNFWKVMSCTPGVWQFYYIRLNFEDLLVNSTCCLKILLCMITYSQNWWMRIATAGKLCSPHMQKHSVMYWFLISHYNIFLQNMGKFRFSFQFY